MARVVWSHQATAQVDATAAYLELFDPASAQRTSARLMALGESLASFPHRGRLSFNGARELVAVRPYVLRYEVLDDGTVLILSVRHSAQFNPDD